VKEIIVKFDEAIVVGSYASGNMLHETPCTYRLIRVGNYRNFIQTDKAD
jgi:hypothetical protein